MAERRRHRRPRASRGPACQYYTPQSARGAMARPSACRLCGRELAPSSGAPRSHCAGCSSKAGRQPAGTTSAKCGVCGNDFSAKTRLARYCSDECRAEGRRRYHCEYQRKSRADPEKHAVIIARTRASAAARRARKRGGMPPPPPPRGAKKAKPSACRVCGRIFVPTGHIRHIAHCGRCRARLEREINRVMTVGCKACGKRFSTKSRVVRYCSKECRAGARKRYDREYMRRRAADPERYAPR